MAIKAVIFDLDGTLLNTLDDLYLSVNYALKQFEYPLRTKEEVRNFVGNGIRDLMTRSCPENINDFEECLACFKAHYSEHSQDNTRPYDDIMKLLETLNKRGIKCAIVSNKFDGAVQELKSKYFDGLITVAVGESPEIKKKPAPDSVLKVMELLNVKNDEVVFVGDADTDIETSKNADIKCVSVLWGFRSKEFLLEKGGKIFVNKPLEILEYIN
ncbi:MAG: HAD family hydrolase [Clostridiales bacterium]|nr:HAD family hydrolase [Clostridiales bacterium]